MISELAAIFCVAHFSMHPLVVSRISGALDHCTDDMLRDALGPHSRDHARDRVLCGGFKDAACNVIERRVGRLPHDVAGLSSFEGRLDAANGIASRDQAKCAAPMSGGGSQQSDGETQADDGAHRGNVAPMAEQHRCDPVTEFFFMASPHRAEKSIFTNKVERSEACARLSAYRPQNRHQRRDVLVVSRPMTRPPASRMVVVLPLVVAVPVVRPLASR